MSHLDLFQDVLNQEAQALLTAKSRITQDQVDQLTEIFQILLETDGDLVFCGVGKSGHIGVKLAATFSSLGLSSYFLHPTEALHGDLGRLKRADAIVLLSKSGTTDELMKLLPYVEIDKKMRIGLIGAPHSPLAKECGVAFDCSVDKEACLNNLAPTTSTTLAMAMGDAMAVLYEKLTGLSKENFATYHPAGLLGKSLRLTVQHLMIDRNNSAFVKSDERLKDAIMAMTNKPTGLCAVLNGDDSLKGIIVEGDIRRAIADDHDLKTNVSTLMNKTPVVIESSKMAYEALELMENREHPISVLPVVDNGKYIGVIRLHDLMKEGFNSKKSK